jgi:hypothetical protein
MKDDLESKMAEVIAEAIEEKPSPTLIEELQILQVQGFLKLFGVVSQFDEEKKADIQKHAVTYNNPNNSLLARQSALINVCELFFPEQARKPVKQILRKNESNNQTPCEDCQTTPTHLIQFKQENRIEEHYLCEECEKAAISAEEHDE